MVPLRKLYYTVITLEYYWFYKLYFNVATEVFYFGGWFIDRYHILQIGYFLLFVNIVCKLNNVIIMFVLAENKNVKEEFHFIVEPGAEMPLLSVSPTNTKLNHDNRSKS